MFYCIGWNCPQMDKVFLPVWQNIHMKVKFLVRGQYVYILHFVFIGFEIFLAVLLPELCYLEKPAKWWTNISLKATTSCLNLSISTSWTSSPKDSDTPEDLGWGGRGHMN